ncbi:hypothetical protein [Corynebacterium stationis]|uniref:hypothetical protein n=1 Tax=Corynebacterium stationis TaxID=1705 RepID=UPI0028A727CD|nr:hypothetical protein [Corynebacterium stationis]
MAEKDVAAHPRTTRILDEVEMMPNSFELEKVRLSKFISDLYTLMEEHIVSIYFKDDLTRALDDALEKLENLEQKNG